MKRGVNKGQIQIQPPEPAHEKVMESGLCLKKMGAAAFDNCWDFFDRIYCISLDERTDRRDEAKNQFRRVGLLERVEFALVRRHPEDCEQGIYESHMACIRSGIQAGAGSILIFEDDILFDRFSSSRVKRCVDFLSDVPDWNLLFLGCLVRSSRRTANENVLQVRYRSLAHAYALNRRFAEVLIEKPWHGVAFDGMLSTFEQGCYALYPSIAFQSNSPTDNTKTLRLDKFRRFWGGLRLIQKMDEVYHLHRGAFISIHLLVVLFILLWIF